jgi:hypothetical protein
MRIIFSDTMTGEDFWTDVTGVTFDGPSVGEALRAKLEVGMVPEGLESATKVDVLAWVKDGDCVACFIFRMDDGMSGGLVHGVAHLVYDPAWVPVGPTEC